MSEALISQEKSPIFDYDDLLNTVVQPLGGWQWSQIAILFLPMSVPLVLLPAFANLVPPHRCRSPTLDYPATNLTYTMITNLTIPSKPDPASPPMIGQDYYPCHRFVQISDPNTSSHTALEPCRDGFTFDTTSSPEYVGTLVEAFQLVCERSSLGPVSLFVFMAAQMLASVTMGYLSDRIGRKPIITTGGFVVLIAGTIIAFSPNIIVYCMLQFVLGFSTVAVFNTGYVYLFEITSRSYWTLIIFICVVCYNGLSMSLISFSAYLLANWQYLHLTMLIFCGSCLLFPCLLCESPRWLITKGQTGKAYEILNTAFIKNNPDERRNLSELLASNSYLLTNGDKQVEKSSEKSWKQRVGEVLVLFTTPVLCRRTCLLMYIWFLNGSVSYGCTYNSVKIHTNIYLTMCSMGFASIVACSVRYALYDRLPRRQFLLGSITLSLISFLVFFIIQIFNGNSANSGLIEALLSVLIKFFIEVSDTVTLGYSGELFPTEVRNYGIGVCMACYRLASAFTPFIIQLGDTVWRPLPILVFLGNLTLGVAVTLALPETRGVVLSEKVAELSAAREIASSRSSAKEEELAGGSNIIVVELECS